MLINIVSNPERFSKRGYKAPRIKPTKARSGAGMLRLG
jgi:hypothetical protein